MKTFNVGDVVNIESIWFNAIGKIVEVVPPGCRPLKYIISGARKKHESYVVAVEMVGTQNRPLSPKLYWVRASALKQDSKP